MLSKGALRTKFVLLLGILILVNLVGYNFYQRLDFTGDRRYTLSTATKDIMRSLEEPLTVKAYFSEDLPPQFGDVRKEFKESLMEYQSLSGGLLNYEFINPNESEEIEKEAQTAGVPPQMLRVREKDQVVQKRVYFGAVLSYGDKTEVIQSIPPGAALEYALTSTIKKMSVKNKAAIGFVQGHGEASIQSMQQAATELNILYNIGAVNLADTSFINQYKTIAIVAPKDSFSLTELNNLDAFLAQGKGLCLALNRVDANFQTISGNAVNTGLEQWLENKGVRVEDNFILDQKCGNVSVPQKRGFFTFNQAVPFPYLPIIQDFADHPITKGLEQVSLMFASPVSFTPLDGISYIPLAFSSAKSALQAVPNTFDISKEWRPGDFNMPKQSVGAVVEGNLSGNISSRMVVYSDGDFAVNGEGREAKQVGPDNVSLFVNAVDWLSDDTGLNELRTKVVSSRPLKADLSDGQKLTIRVLNFLLPIALILFYGLFRWMRRKSQKRKWMNERYA